MTDTYYEVDLFNRMAGKNRAGVGSYQYWKDIENQTKRIAEELEELVKAINARDIKEVVDAGGDLDVVVAGLNRITGADYQGVIKVINANNFDKVFCDSDYSAAEYQCNAFNSNFGEERYRVVTASVDGTDYHTIQRNRDNKIMKPFDHKKVDLSPYLPELEVAQVLVAKDLEDLDQRVSQMSEQFNMTLLSLEDFDETAKELFSGFMVNSPYLVVSVEIATNSIVEVHELTLQEGEPDVQQ